MLSDALAFPRRSEDWLSTTLIGGILTFLATLGPLLLFVPVLLLQGYLLRVLDRAARDERTPPSFTQWGTLIVDGLKVLVVSLVYGLVVFVPLTVVVGALVIIVPTDPVVTESTGPMPIEPGGVPPAPQPTGSGEGLLVFLALVAVVGLLGLFVGYVLPAALANFAVEGRIGSAFALRTILAGAFTADYAVAWLLALVVGAVGGLVGSALSVVLVGVFVLFYVQVSFYYLVGRGFAAGLESKRWNEP